MVRKNEFRLSTLSVMYRPRSKSVTSVSVKQMLMLTNASRKPAANLLKLFRLQRATALPW
jgi:hypothetical protein